MEKYINKKIDSSDINNNNKIGSKIYNIGKSILGIDILKKELFNYHQKLLSTTANNNNNNNSELDTTNNDNAKKNVLSEKKKNNSSSSNNSSNSDIISSIINNTKNEIEKNIEIQERILDKILDKSIYNNIQGLIHNNKAAKIRTGNYTETSNNAGIVELLNTDISTPDIVCLGYDKYIKYGARGFLMYIRDSIEQHVPILCNTVSFSWISLFEKDISESENPEAYRKLLENTLSIEYSIARSKYWKIVYAVLDRRIQEKEKVDAISWISSTDWDKLYEELKKIWGMKSIEKYKYIFVRKMEDLNKKGGFGGGFGGGKEYSERRFKKEWKKTTQPYYINTNFSFVKNNVFGKGREFDIAMWLGVQKYWIDKFELYQQKKKNKNLEKRYSLESLDDEEDSDSDMNLDGDEYDQNGFQHYSVGELSLYQDVEKLLSKSKKYEKKKKNIDDDNNNNNSELNSNNSDLDDSDNNNNLMNNNLKKNNNILWSDENSEGFEEE